MRARFEPGPHALQADRLPPFVVIFGPTGTGKTDLACGIADRLDCRLISADAVQVYRGLSAAAAKPRGEQLRHPWALVDCVDPQQDFDLGRWVRAAESELARAERDGRHALVVGGTGLYIRGLIKGVDAAPPRNDLVRERLRDLAERHGTPFLHRVLSRLDSESAGHLTPRDRQRLIRALEVRLVTGRTPGEIHRWRWRGPDRTDVLRIGLRIERELLHERIDRRVEAFFADGLIEEVRGLLGEGVPRSANALKAIGYREVVEWLGAQQDGPRRPCDSQRQLIRIVQRNTRRYAKRQMTWFRSERPTAWLDAVDPAVVEVATRLVRDFFEGGAGPPATA
jgi:tRNA dimethylallyltransferase